MDRDTFIDVLADGPLLADGGFGTSLVAQGADPEDCLEAFNLTRPEFVAGIHRGFAEAGARLVHTNTWGANRFKLAPRGFGERVAELNRAGVGIARRAAEGCLLAGSVGPLGVHLAPYGRVPVDAARAAYAEQITALAEAGVDLIVIETQTDLNEMEQALAAARAVCDLPVVVSATFTRDDRTLLGQPAARVARRLAESGADMVGVNCSQGPAQVLRIVEQMRAAMPDVPISGRPNAGGPAQIAGRLVYPATPAYFAEQARELAGFGAAIIGGCCGTGPEHILAMAQALAEPVSEPPTVSVGEAEHEEEAAVAPGPTAFGQHLAEGGFAIAVEMDPPHSSSAARLLAAAETLADAGADVVTVADAPLARMRMSPWAVCRLIQEQVGIDTVLHFPTRGRNILRVQGDLLAAHALGIRNVFVCLGDPTDIGDYPEAASNVDVAPTGLIKLLARGFNRGVDQAGAEIGEATRFVVGCALNLGTPDLERECRLLKRKVDSGADFALTQPVYDPEVLIAFRRTYEERYGPLELPLLVGALPLVSARHAAFLHNEVPGISIPESIRKELADALDRPAAERIGMRVAQELATALREHAAGIYLMPPFNRYDLAAELVENVSEKD